MQKKPINPQTWLNGFHMNHGIEVSNGQRVLYVSGQTSNDATGASMHEGDYKSQFKLAWNNLVEVLEASNMKPENIVRLNFYTTDVDAFMANAAEFQDLACARLHAGQHLTRRAAPLHASHANRGGGDSRRLSPGRSSIRSLADEDPDSETNFRPERGHGALGLVQRDK